MEKENKYVFEPIDQKINTFDGIIFDENDYKPNNILTAEQTELINNGYYLSAPLVNPTASLFQQQDQSDATDGGYSTYYDEELPTKDDGIVSNVDGSFSSTVNPTYEEERTNEHKFFAASVDEIDQFKDNWKTTNSDVKPVIASQNIFNLPRIDEPENTANEEELEKTKVMQFSSYNNSDNSKAA